MKILNFTQHAPSTEQKTAGVYDPSKASFLAAKAAILNFAALPSREELEQRERDACDLFEIAKEEGAKHVLLGGAPFFMAALERAAVKAGLEPVYAFSKRESVEETLPDGSVIKKSVFVHEGFVHVN